MFKAILVPYLTIINGLLNSFQAAKSESREKPRSVRLLEVKVSPYSRTIPGAGIPHSAGALMLNPSSPCQTFLNEVAVAAEAGWLATKKAVMTARVSGARRRGE